LKRHPVKNAPPEERVNPHLSRRRFLLLLGIVAVLGAVLRLVVAFEFAKINGGANNLLSPSKVTDMATYIDLAHQIVSGTYSGEFYYQPFYYAVFLPLVYLLGGGIWTVVVVQCLLGGATVWFSGLSAEKLFSRFSSLLTAFLVAVSTPLLLYAPFHLNETLQTFNLTLLFYLFLLAGERRTWYWWGGCGVVAGVAVLTRGNALLLLFAPAVWAAKQLIRDRERRRGMVAGIAAFVAALLLVELPFIWHNTRVTGKLCGPSTASGAVLALGNTPEAPPGGREPGLPAGPMEYPESWHRMMRLQEQGISVPRQMWNWFREAPAAFLELQFRKILLFWDHREIPNNVSLYGEGAQSLLLCILLIGRSAVLLTLALAGALLMLPRLRKAGFGLWLLYGFVTIYWLSIALFYDLSRFRAPILPLAAVLAAGAVEYVREKPSRERMLRFTAAVLAGLWLCVFSYETYRNHCERTVMRLVRPDGTKIVGADGKTWIFDNGPRTFGGWQGVAVKPGMKLEKRFVGGNRGEAWLKVFADSPGVFLTDCGGTTLKPGENDVLLGFLPTDCWFGVTVFEAPPGTMLALDLQRDYGRTRIDGEKAPGELVVCFSPVL
jgi:4-amino-4-deoxy-L-arabinose transferase-like glycosyltransferase